MHKLLLLVVFFSTNVFAIPVNINNADAITISTALTGVSLKKAEAIVADRSRHGTFKHLTDLKRVIGIGDKTITVNKTDILFTDEAVAPATIIPNQTLTPSPAIEITSSATDQQRLNPTRWLIAGILILMIVFLVIVIRKYSQQKKPTLAQ